MTEAGVKANSSSQLKHTRERRGAPGAHHPLPGTSPVLGTRLRVPRANQTYQAGFSYTLQWLWMSPAEFTALIKETSWISQNSGEVHKDRTQWLTVLPELPAIGLSTTSDTQAASVLNYA